MRKLMSRLLLGVSALLAQGCLYTAQHLNTGRVLAPGETAVGLGLGAGRFQEFTCPDGTYEDEDDRGFSRCYSGFGSEETTAKDVPPKIRTRPIPMASLAYRVGVRRQWGPLTGFEIGWHIEAPNSPVSVEFDAKAGLPTGKLPEDFAHSLSLGWGIGLWADNTWFAEYALSREYGPAVPFANFRLSYLATPLEAHYDFDETRQFRHEREWLFQTTWGGSLSIGEVAVLPDLITPFLTLTAPAAPTAVEGRIRREHWRAVAFQFGLGLEWRFP